MSDRLVCVVGSVNIDTTYDVGHLPAAGETILAGSRQVSHGGKGANQAAAAAASGASVAMVGAVGADDQGRSAVQDLADRGVDVESVARHDDRPTGSAVIVVDEHGENVIVVDPGSNSSLDAGWTAAHVRRLSPAVLLGQLEIPVEALVAAAQAAPDATFVLNPAPIPQDPAVLSELLNQVDVLVPNRTELGRLLGRSEPGTLEDVDAYARDLAFGRTLVVTLGAEGAMVYVDSQRVAHVPAADVSPVDTSGAGDAFCGALAHRLASGATVEDAVQRAVQLAGHSTTHRGARLPVGVSVRAD